MTTTTNFTTLPLSQLRIDEKANVRHANRGVDPVLLQSIKAIGLLQPLNVRPNGKGYIVYAGGQRFLALKEIAKEQDTPDMPVPVVVSDDHDAKARERSLHENVARSAMHPVDEYRAYSTLHTDKEHPLTVAEIAQRFGISERGVNQRLALGALDDSVLNAWQAGEINAACAKLFTLEPSKKLQKAALEKARVAGRMDDWQIKQALGLSNDHTLAGMLRLVGEDAYVKRGGKVIRDLFADDRFDDTRVSDPSLLKTMAEELLDAEVKRLQSEGWVNASRERPLNLWELDRLETKVKPTKEEAARLKEIDKLLAQAEEADEDATALDDERERIQQTIEARALASIDAKQKAEAIVVVNLNHKGDTIETTFRMKKVQQQKKPDAKAEAKKQLPAEDALSQALLVRQGEQMTAAVAKTVLSQPHVGIAYLVASLTSLGSADGPVMLGSLESGVTWQKRQKAPSFTTTLAAALKMTTAQQIAALVEITAKHVKLVRRYPTQGVLQHADFAAVAAALDGKKLTSALRETWDAKDYFDSVSRTVIVEAVREAMGDDHARKVEGMNKADAVKFATGNLPKLKWLPKQLRVAGYDGPAKKASAAKKAAPAKKKAKR